MRLFFVQMGHDFRVSGYFDDGRDSHEKHNVGAGDILANQGQKFKGKFGPKLINLKRPFIGGKICCQNASTIRVQFWPSFLGGRGKYKLRSLEQIVICWKSLILFGGWICSQESQPFLIFPKIPLNHQSRWWREAFIVPGTWSFGNKLSCFNIPWFLP